MRLGPEEKALIQEIVAGLAAPSPIFPLAMEFRVRHETNRHLIDGLLKVGFLRLSFGRYVPTIDALRACGTDQARGAIRECNAILDVLKQKFRFNPTKSQWTPAELLESTRFTEVDIQVFLTLIYHSNVQFLGGGGVSSSGFINKVVLHGDAILDAEPFEELEAEDEVIAEGVATIRRLFLHNYKCHVNSEIPLAPVTLLVGPNGAGKSAILDAVFALRELLGGAARVDSTGVFPSDSLTAWQSHRNQIIECTIAVGDEELAYRIEIEHNPESRRARIILEQLKSRHGLLFEFKMGEVTLFRDNGTKGPTFAADWTVSAMARVAPRGDNRLVTRFLDVLRGTVICSLYPRDFADEASEESPVLLRDGSNFTAWYRHISAERQDRIGEYVIELRKVIDGLKGVRLESTGRETRALMIAFEQEGADGRHELRLAQLSDGQRALLGLYALTGLGAGQGSVLFLDEPDNYVALPEIQPWLMALRDKVGTEIPQVVIASHHPELIDYFGPEAGLWVDREQCGPSRVRKLLVPANGALKLSELIARGWNE